MPLLRSNDLKLKVPDNCKVDSCIKTDQDHIEDADKLIRDATAKKGYLCMLDWFLETKRNSDLLSQGHAGKLCARSWLPRVCCSVPLHLGGNVFVKTRLTHAGWFLENWDRNFYQYFQSSEGSCSNVDNDGLCPNPGNCHDYPLPEAYWMAYMMKNFQERAISIYSAILHNSFKAMIDKVDEIVDDFPPNEPSEDPAKQALGIISEVLGDVVNGKGTGRFRPG